MLCCVQRHLLAAPPLYEAPPSLLLGTCVISRYATAQTHLYFRYLSTPIRHDDRTPYFEQNVFQNHETSPGRRNLGHHCINNCAYLYDIQSEALVKMSLLSIP